MLRGEAVSQTTVITLSAVVLTPAGSRKRLSGDVVSYSRRWVVGSECGVGEGGGEKRGLSANLVVAEQS